MQKIVIINRAVPGSGKTTITNCIIDELKKNDISVMIHSTDEYFMVGNRYVFEIEKLGKYHEENLKEFEKSIKENVDVIICDNTNIAPWQTEPYSRLARDNNYQVLIITLDPRELVKHLASQQVTFEKPDAHEVGEEILMRMMKEYHVFNDLLNPRMLIDETKHIYYTWDNELNRKIGMGSTKNFDSDFIIRILPDEYKMAQKNIGKRVLKLMMESMR